MIETKTTKQIIEYARSEIDFYSFKSVEGKKLIAYPLIDDKEGKEIIKKVWVGLESLKKEMPSAEEMERDCEGSCIIFLKKLERLMK